MGANPTLAFTHVAGQDRGCIRGRAARTRVDRWRARDAQRTAPSGFAVPTQSAVRAGAIPATGGGWFATADLDAAAAGLTRDTADACCPGSDSTDERLAAGRRRHAVHRHRRSATHSNTTRTSSAWPTTATDRQY